MKLFLISSKKQMSFVLLIMLLFSLPYSLTESQTNLVLTYGKRKKNQETNTFICLQGTRKHAKEWL